MWFQVLKDLQRKLQKDFPNLKVFIGKKTPPGQSDYPFASLIPVKFTYGEEFFQMEVALWFGVKVSEKDEEAGLNEFLNLFHDLNMFLFQNSTFGNCEIFLGTIGLINIQRNHPYYEGEIDFKVRIPFEAVKNIKTFDGYYG